MIPPIKPATTAPTAVMFPQPAVILTKPAKAPFNVCAKFGLPYQIQVVTNAPSPPAAAAKFVINTTLEFDIEYYLFPPIADGKLIRKAIINLIPDMDSSAIDADSDTITATLNPFMADPEDEFTIDEEWS